MEIESNRKKQETGIRQGCPLSPYLFIIYMTIMFADVKGELRGAGLQYRVQGANFDEVLFADDTIQHFAGYEKIMNRMLKAIEVIGRKSGMRFNKGKCEAFKYGGNAQLITGQNRGEIQVPGLCTQ